MKLGVLTSGGDSPGMNAAIRAIARSAISAGIEPIGIRSGYVGLLNEDIAPINVQDVADIIQRGGTMLRTARSNEIRSRKGVLRAKEILEMYNIDCLVAIGGDGTYRGANELSKVGVKVITIPATIDNDVASSDYSIGFDTALNTAVEAISKIRDTSFSNDRVDVVEVMGRDCGKIALHAGLAGGAEVIMVPEAKTSIQEVVDTILRGKNRRKLHSIIVYAEGAGNMDELCRQLEKSIDVVVRTTRLGYIQRGGSPSAFDRILASMMGAYSVDLAVAGIYNVAVCYRKGEYIATPLSSAVEMDNSFDNTMYDVAMKLSI
ncbi:MAG: 6-phosphofructokinase [Eubacteriaceae bacterium]|nr:6-phosphofructokinase [Eubacteriaceae bacterium]